MKEEVASKRILVTGGAGFIGSNFVRKVLSEKDPELVVTLDKLTYAGSLDNLRDLPNAEKHVFVKGDICDAGRVNSLFAEQSFDVVFNFAAESHVDRSIQSSAPFVQSNVVGTQVLLDAALKHGVKKFVQVGTDEEYGSIQSGSFKETDGLNPSSPYSASKAAASLLARSFFVTHRLAVVITRSTNNYGPFQHPEKFIPLFVTNALRERKCPLYGSGANVRDWLFVADNCEGIWLAGEKGVAGEVYNIGAGNEMANVDVAKKIIQLLGKKPESLVQPVPDRKGHDLRYSVDASKLRALGWRPEKSFEEGLEQTIEWYKANEWWWKPRASA